MPALKTQIIDENPRVLLLGKYLPFLKSMEKLFSGYQINTWLLTDQEIKHIDASSLSEKNTYKIVWWADLNEVNSFELTRDFLAKNKEIPLLIISPLPEQFLPLTEKETSFSELQRKTDKLIKDFPQAQFFFIRDFFGKKYLSPLFRISLQGLDKGKLFNPNKDNHFVSLEEVVKSLESILLKPHIPQKILIKGKKTKSSDVLDYFSKIFERVYDQSLSSIQVETTRLNIELLDFIEVKVNSNEKKIIEEIIEEKNDLKQQLSSLPSFKIKTASKKASKVSKTEDILNDDEIVDERNVELEKKPIHQSKESIEETEEKLEGELSRLFKEKRVDKKDKRIDEKVKIVKKISSKSKKNKVLFFGGVGVMILGGIVLALWFILEMSIFFAKKDFYSYLSKNTPQNHTKFETGFWADSLNKQLNTYENVLGEIISEKTMASDLLQNFEQLQTLQEQLDYLIQEYTLGILGVGESKQIFPEEIITLSSEIEVKVSSIEEAIFYLSSEETEEQKRWTGYLEEYREKISQISQFKEFFTELFGGNGKRTYAVLLQNSLETRPTGGFIQGFALLTFSDGKLIDSQILHTNEVDTRLPGAVNSPDELKRYLGEKTWFMRDSNWDPDFPTTADRVTWFIRESLKKQVDGVIAINHYVLQDLINAVGSLEIVEYQETLTKDNLLERVEFHSDDELVQQNETKKADYTALIYNQLFKKLKEINGDQAKGLVSAFKVGLENKNVLISMADEEHSSLLQKMGWNGEIIFPVCPQRFPQTNCIVNKIYQVESNIGLNRINEYIDRQVQERVDFSGKNIKHIRTMTFTNMAKTDGWPLGSYRLYLRLISDKNTKPKEVLINGKKLDSGLANVYTERESKVVGFPLEIPKDSTVTVEYTYETEKVLDEPFSFLLFDQKQPGVNREDLQTVFYFPNKKPTLIAPQGNLVGDTLDFTAEENEHSFVGVSLQNK